MRPRHIWFGLMTTATVATSYTAALADDVTLGDDVIVTTTRTTVRGKLIENFRGHHVIVRVRDGTVQRFDSQEIERLERWTDRDRPFRVEAMLGIAASPASSTLSTLTSRVGLRVGYTFLSRFYVGALYAIHPGVSQATVEDCGDPCSLAMRARRGAIATTTRLLGGELGYEVTWPSTILRFYFGAGAMLFSGWEDFGSFKESNGKPGAIVWPGVNVVIPFSDAAFVGVDAQYALPAGNVYASSVVDASLLWGLRFR